MINQTPSQGDRVAGIDYLRAGVVELMVRQKPGYAHNIP